MLAPVRTAKPQAEPVSLEEAKAQLRVDFADDDALIASLIAAATAHVDGWSGTLGRALIDQTWEQAFRCFASPLRLPLAPVSVISGIAYFDSDNATQTLSTDVYQLLTDERGAKITLKADQTWPGTYSREDAVTVTFVAGYGAADSNVPEDLRDAIVLHVKRRYEPLTEGEHRVNVERYNALIRKYSRLGF